MSREEIVNSLLNMRPQIISIDEMEGLSTEELIQIYNANSRIKYCDMIIKSQMIHVILYMGGPLYTKKALLLMDHAEIYKIYLAVRGLKEEEFNLLVSNAVEDFKASAKANDIDDYLEFSDTELLVATGIIIPDPLLSFEEVQTQSTLKRIDEITKEIAELEDDNLATERQIESTTNYMLRSELQQDLICNGRRIAELQGELKSLIANKNGLPRK